MPRRFNCCVFNHPRPIFCPINLSCTNEVVNPSFGNDFGFFNNLNVGVIDSQARIPASLVVSEGFSVSADGTGAVTLIAGSYEVSYLANGNVPASGTLSIKLRLNGVDLSGSVIQINQTSGDIVNLNQTMIISILETSTLELANNSSDSATIQYASISVRRI